MELTGPAMVARDVLRAIGTALVSKPSEFDALVEMHGRTATVFVIRAAVEDRGQMIGRDGRMFMALQEVVRAIGELGHHQVSISEVMAPTRVCLIRRRNNPPFNANWPKKDTQLLAGVVCSAMFGEPVEVSLVEGSKTACLSISGNNIIGHRRSDDVMEAIRTIFHAVGIAHGCKLVVDFSPKGTE